VEPKETLHVIGEDPGDDLVLECAVAGRAETIVSGDRHLLTLASFRGHFDHAGAAIPRFDRTKTGFNVIGSGNKTGKDAGDAERVERTAPDPRGDRTQPRRSASGCR
jgi:hypothetical protein